MITFAFTAMDQIVNQMAKIHYMFGGQATFPIVFRASTGGGRSAAAQHSQSPHPMFMNLAGVKLVMPATPYDAKGLMKSAIRDNNPVIFFEDRILRPARRQGPRAEEEYTIPLGVAEVKRPGSDVTVIAIAKMVPEALAAAEALARDGIAAEVVDPRTLVPLDKATLRASVQKTGRVVIVDEACITCSAAAEIAALLTEDAPTFRALQAPPKRVCAPMSPYPTARSWSSFVCRTHSASCKGYGRCLTTNGRLGERFNALQPPTSTCTCRHHLHTLRQTCYNGRSVLMHTSHMPHARKENTMAERRVPTREEVLGYLHDRRNWGRWGKDDQVGALNLITPEKRVKAAALVRSGRSLSLSRDFPKLPTGGNVYPAQHWMKIVPRGTGGFSADYYGIYYHGIASTHLDALCHTWDDQGMWNGRDPAREITFEGATFGRLSIGALASSRAASCSMSQNIAVSRMSPWKNPCTAGSSKTSLPPRASPWSPAMPSWSTAAGKHCRQPIQASITTPRRLPGPRLYAPPARLLPAVLAR